MPEVEIDQVASAGAHSLYPRHGGGFECCQCDMPFDSPEDARRRPCVAFGAW